LITLPQILKERGGIFGEFQLETGLLVHPV
jgi:hypothetical protein